MQEDFMTSSRTAPAGMNWQRVVSACAGLLAALVLSLPGTAAHAVPSKDSTLSKEDQACLECHARPGQQKTLANGEQLSLLVPAAPFAGSKHASSGCEACHSDIDVKTHTTKPKNVASRRALATEMMDTCRDCHKKAVQQYQDSVHSALVRTGSDKAPLCSDCHNPHATKSLKEASDNHEPVVCTNCHAGIGRAFAQSVHGSAGDEALTCKDCHRTHNVQAAAFADHMKTECVSCHKDVVASHDKWLPNTERHLEAISCPACHSPGATRRVNLRLYEGGAPQQSADKLGVPKFIKLASWADATGAGLDTRALWSLLQEFNQGGATGKTMLRGRLEVQTGEQAHQLAGKARAVKECDTCHREGATPFQTVTVSMAGPDGRPLRHQAREGVLTSPESIGFVGGFYAIGGTRIKLLDMLLLLVLAGGILVPAGHLTMKMIAKRQQARAQASGNTPAAADIESNEPRK
jgi:predicted CXXCH cytochrome family protein